MDKRKIKQIIYGAAYLAVFFLIIWGAYSLWFKPAPTCFDNKQNGNETGIDCGGSCIPCEIKTLSSLEANSIKFFPINSADGATIIALEVKNSNQNYGADNFNYVLNIYGNDSGQIKNISGSSYIYAGDLKYIIETTDVDAKNISQIKADFSNTSWKAKTEFPEPVLQTREITTAAADNTKGGIVVNGLVNNNNAFGISKLYAIAFLFNIDNVEIGAAKTELDNIPPFEEIPFTINFSNTVSLIPAAPATPKVFVFTRNLTVGSQGNDVLRLEQFLADQGLLNRDPGNYFGASTKDALTKYQKKVGISPANGYFGNKTRNDINSQLPKTPSSTEPSANQADPTKTIVKVEALR